MPEKPKELSRPAGEWTMIGVGHMGGREPMHGAGHEEPTADGFRLSGRQCMNDPEAKELACYGPDLWGYNPGADEYHYFRTDNAAQAHDPRGEFVKPNLSALDYLGKQEGMEYLEREQLAFVRDDASRLKGDVRVDSETFVDFDMTFTKKAA